MAWFHNRVVLERFVSDLMAGELARLRPEGDAAFAFAPGTQPVRLDEEGLALNSLERLSIASALTATLHLQESGLEDLLLSRRTLQEWVDIAERGLEHFNACLTFHTSGSSGKPKACTHGLETLLQESAFHTTLFPQIQRVLFAVPTHHIYGFLFAVLLPARLDADSVDIRHVTPQGLRKLLRPHDLIVSHPSHWAVLCRYITAFPDRVEGVSSTAACPVELAGGLIEAGLQRLVQVYGSSETGGVGWRADPGGAYELFPFWARDPTDAAQLLRTDPTGSVRRFKPQDRLVWQTDLRFTPEGRLDGAIQVNGVNVFPAHIRQVLLQHPKVSDAAVRLISDAAGDRLKAFIVPSPGSDPSTLPTDLSDWANTRLTAVERPRSFTVGAALPINALGKPSDWTI